ncbi:MAG: UbiH/UbiF family hydroxylase [Burkholderiales bacterium]|nr:UbiH/UbiF family hydroxylase [Burkholderiales bacterium]
MKTHDYDILIVGGGLVGASLALALASRWRVALLERSAPPQASSEPDVWDSRIYAVSPGNRAFLESMGGWRVPATRVGNIREMDVRGDDGGLICFDALDMAAERLAATVENSALQASLWQALEGRVTLIAGSKAVAASFDADRASIELDDGRKITTALAVAADGAQSWLRQAAGIDFERRPYGQLGVVANFRCERSHGDIARQWFRNDGILAWLPLPGNRISIVWSTDEQKSAELRALDGEALADRVAAAGGRQLGALQTITPAAAFPLALGKAATVTAQRLALVGDAAHTVHPLAGQGVNLGFGDARCLAEMLAPAHVDDPGAAHLLARYARARAEEVWTMQTLCDGLQRLFGSRDPVLAGLRNFGLSMTNRAGPLKRVLMRRAFQ